MLKMLLYGRVKTYENVNKGKKWIRILYVDIRREKVAQNACLINACSK
jgi:hypothetical protein